MRNSNLKLDKILDLKKWQSLQDSLSTVTKSAIITIDYKGNPITTHSNCNAFCQSIRKDSVLYKRCQKCDSRGGLEAVRSNKPYIYLCHFNIIDIAIPITVDDKYLGAVLAGQIRLAIPEAGDHLEKIFPSAHSLDLLNSSPELLEYYDQIPKLNCTEIMSIARMLSSLCSYIVEEALNKNLILEMHERLLNTTSIESTSDYSGYSIENLTQVKDELSNAMTNAHISSPYAETYTSKNSILKPIFEYIFSHKSENLSLSDAASMCHISPSYFSRVFAKEVNETYSSYITRLKINWSKRILECTDLSIAQISDDLGFSEPGYFIKTFKKLENITPSVYRKYYQ